MKNYDEVKTLITLKKFGILQGVPEHLQEEFDRRWAESEEQRKAEKLKNDPLSIKRYDDDDGYYGRYEYEAGPYVLYEDFVKVVEHLKQEISRAYSSGKSAGEDRSGSWRD